jgi:hypothetical protein
LRALRALLASHGSSRRWVIAAGIYALTSAVYFAFADAQTLTEHTPFNHYALLAQAWLEGRMDLGHGPPSYTGNNDFALYQGKWFVIFPPLPAVLLLPWVWLAGSAEAVCDGQFFLWLAGVGPAVLFLALEQMGQAGLGRSTKANVSLALLFAFGSVYFFTAEQGTVWFAAHVVAVALGAAYLLFALDASHPMLAGLMLGLAVAARGPLLLGVPLFLLEAVRVARRPTVESAASAEPTRVLSRAWWTHQRFTLPAFARRIDTGRLLRTVGWFLLPFASIVGLLLWYNQARFGHPLEFGYRYLTVAWQPRMDKWGLTSYHYLARNLGVALTSLPYLTRSPTAAAPFQVNGHGLALWVTTPLYFWLLWPCRKSPLHLPLWLTVAAVALPSLLYQNTGWLQFGYRFSNDYAVFLFALLAVGGRRMGTLFAVAAAWSVLVNGFGAATFGRAEYARYYFIEPTQRVIYQPD